MKRKLKYSEYLNSEIIQETPSKETPSKETPSKETPSEETPSKETPLKKIKKSKCSGCFPDYQPNQLAHIGPNGCLGDWDIMY